MALIAVLLPPVITRIEGERIDIPGGDQGTGKERLDGAAMPTLVRTEGPQPGPVTVQLEVPPCIVRLVAIDGVAGVEVVAGGYDLAARGSIDERLDTIRARLKDARAPAEVRLRRRDLADAAHRIRDERAVTQPREAIDREGRRGREMRRWAPGWRG